MTFKQFILSGWRSGVVFSNLYNFAVFIAVMLIVPVGAFAVALSFTKSHNRPFRKSPKTPSDISRRQKFMFGKKENIQQPTTIDQLTLEAGGDNKPAIYTQAYQKKQT